MSEFPKYECRSCGVKFKADRWPECTNCNEPVPPEIRAQYPAVVESRVTLPPPSRPSSRTPRRTEPQTGNRASDVVGQASQSFDHASQLSADARAIISSQNRTTYAVRSLALYLFISLQSALFGGGMIGLAINNSSHYDAYGALNSGASFFVTLGALIVFAGFVVSVVVGRWELDKSKVSGRDSQY